MYGNESQTEQDFNSSGINPISSSHVIASGYDVKGALPNLKRLHGAVKNGLTITGGDLSVENVQKYETLAGQQKGLNEVFKRQSRAQLDYAREVSKTFSIATNHVDQAMAIEQQLQTNTSRALQSMSGKLLDINSAQSRHSGFAKHLDIADKCFV